MRKAPFLLLTMAFAEPVFAQAAIDNANIFKNATYVQSGIDGLTMTATGGFFNASITSKNPNDFTSATVTLPDTSVQPLTQTSSTNFGIGPSFTTVAAMDAAYPMGDYILTGTESDGSTLSDTLHYTFDGYASNVPQLDKASYDALQGVAANSGLLTLSFNAQSAFPAATSAFTFFTIFDGGGGCGFLAPSATSCTIDTSLLTPGKTYTYELDFSDRNETRGADGALLGVDFDVRTDGTFTVAAVSPLPELSSWALMMAGFGGIGGVLRGDRRRLRRAI